MKSLLKNGLFSLILLVLIVFGIVLIVFITKQSPLNQPSVVTQIQGLNRLETIVYSVEKIVQKGDQGSVLQSFLFGDKILFIAYGQVTAGVDLSKLKPDEVTVNGKNVSIQLPAPQILSTRIDNEKSNVYDRTTGLFTKGDKDLESQVRFEAEKIIEKAACDDGILAKANEQAVKQLSSFLKGLSFEKVDVISTVGNCL